MTSQAELLFTLNGEKGKFKKIRDGVFKAKINNVNDNLIWFTGSPYREAGDWYIQDLIDGWDDAFGNVRPNAAQVITQKDGSKDTLVYEMFKPAYNKKKDTVRFKFKLHDDQKLTNSGKKADEKDEELKDASISPEERELLFSLGGEQGTFEKIRKGVFEAEISEVNDNLIWFTDRPYREAGGVNIQDLIDSWDDAFGKSRPNAAQVITQKNGEKDTLVYEMYKPFYDKKEDTVRFKFKLHDNQALDSLSGSMEKFAYYSDNRFKKNYGDTSLFIDNWKLEDSDLRSVNSFSKDVDLFSVDLGQEGADDEFEMKFEDTNLYIDNFSTTRPTDVEIFNFWGEDIRLLPVEFKKEGDTAGDWALKVLGGAASFAGELVLFNQTGGLGGGIKGPLLTLSRKLGGAIAGTSAKAAAKAALIAGGAYAVAAIGIGVALVDAWQTKYTPYVDDSKDPIIIPDGESARVRNYDSRWGFGNGVADVAFLVATKPVEDPITGVTSAEVIGSVFFDNPHIGDANAKIYPYEGTGDSLPGNLRDDTGIRLGEEITSGNTTRIDFNRGFMELGYEIGEKDEGFCIPTCTSSAQKPWDLRIHQNGEWGF